jgi:phosphoribosylanthranilate isomerase
MPRLQQFFFRDKHDNRPPTSMPSTLVKICGLSTEATLAAALDSGADLVGFVFFPKSPRHVSLALARNLAAQARGRAEITALTVDADDAGFDAIIAAVEPDWLQLHGGEHPGRVRAIRRRTGRRVMKAVGVATAADLASVEAYAEAADMILFDAKPPKHAALPGGNGVSFDWSLLSGLDLRVPFMLSGGLTISTVENAIRTTGAPGVDVSSGVEREPGIKDAAKIHAFVEAARRAA